MSIIARLSYTLQTVPTISLHAANRPVFGFASAETGEEKGKSRAAGT